MLKTNTHTVINGTDIIALNDIVVMFKYLENSIIKKSWIKYIPNEICDILTITVFIRSLNFHFETLLAKNTYTATAIPKTFGIK